MTLQLVMKCVGISIGTVAVQNNRAWPRCQGWLKNSNTVLFVKCSAQPFLTENHRILANFSENNRIQANSSENNRIQVNLTDF